MSFNRAWFGQTVTEDHLNDAYDCPLNDQRNLVIDTGLTGVMSGMVVSQHSTGADLYVTVTSGVAYDGQGHRLSLAGAAIDCSVDHLGVSTAVSAAGRHKCISVFAEWYDATSDAQITKAGDTVYRVHGDGCRLAVYQGAETLTTAALDYPALASSRVLLCDIEFTFGKTTIVTADVTSTRRQDMVAITSTPHSLTAGSINTALSTLLGYINDLAGISISASTVPTTPISGSPMGFGGSTVQAILQLLANWFNDHLNGTSVYKHLAAAINAAAITGTPLSWASGSTVQLILQGLFDYLNDHLNGTTAAYRHYATKIRTTAYMSGVYGISGSTVQSGLEGIVANLNSTTASVAVWQGVAQVIFNTHPTPIALTSEYTDSWGMYKASSISYAVYPNPATGYFLLPGYPFNENACVALQATAIPTGLTANHAYWVKQIDSDNFQLTVGYPATTAGPVTFSDAGTGVTICQYYPYLTAALTGTYLLSVTGDVAVGPLRIDVVLYINGTERATWGVPIQTSCYGIYTGNFINIATAVRLVAYDEVSVRIRQCNGGGTVALYYGAVTLTMLSQTY